MRGSRKILVTTAFTGALLMAAGTPAYAYWIYHYDGAYASAAACGEARQRFIDQETSVGQMFTAGPCALHAVNPETGSGAAGWYYRWGIFAA